MSAYPSKFQPTWYKELETQYQGRRIPYELLLRTHEWLVSRIPILKRDGEQCTKCHTPQTQYGWGKNMYWVKNYDNKIIKDSFWKKWDAFKAQPGNEHNNLQPTEEDYIIVPEYEYETMITVDRPIRLHVHHKLYFEDTLPWNYDPKYLITLCNWCHAELHANEIVPYYRKINNQYVEVKLTPCKRCHGAGFIPEFNHVEDGICFRCNGHKYEEHI